MHTSVIPFRGIPSIDQIFGALERGIEQSDQAKYPPHNIFKVDETSYAIEIAVAGFSPEEIEVTVEDRVLRVSGTKTDPAEAGERIYFHRGLAQRNFRRTFQLARYLEVTDARVKNGILRIDLGLQIPDAAKPRKISITSAE